VSSARPRAAAANVVGQGEKMGGAALAGYGRRLGRRGECLLVNLTTFNRNARIPRCHAVGDLDGCADVVWPRLLVLEQTTYCLSE